MEQHFNIDGMAVAGYVIPLGDVYVALIRTGRGVIACGAIDLQVLASFHIPAATVTGVSSVEDILEKEIQQVNEPARALGLAPGMKTTEAMRLLQPPAR